jgi:hypothetical protein
MATEFSVINCHHWEAKDGAVVHDGQRHLFEVEWRDGTKTEREFDTIKSGCPQGVLVGFIVGSAKLIEGRKQQCLS